MVREALTSEALGVLSPGDAAAYFIARRAEGITTGEQQLLTGWLARDESHRRMFDSADRAWQAFEGANDDEILTAMRAHALAPRRRAWANWQPVAAAAAVVLVAVSAVMSIVPGLNPWTPVSAPTTTMEYASAVGEVKELQLADGSKMTLDANSAAVAHFAANGRSIDLQRGRAFFDVAHDRSRPFAVTAAGKRVVATGTRFDVSMAADTLTVTLLEGRVEIGSADSAEAAVKLEPGQQYVVRLGKPADVLAIGDATENAAMWRTGVVFFNGETFAEAVAILNRYSRDQIVIRDPNVANLKAGGGFRPSSDALRSAQNLADMQSKLGLRAVRNGNEIELIRP